MSDRHVRRILRQIRRRYWRQSQTDRPSLRDPGSYVGMCSHAELHELARCGRWPLSAEAIQYIAESPRTRVQRRRQYERAVEDALAEILATQSAAIRVLLYPPDGRPYA